MQENNLSKLQSSHATWSSLVFCLSITSRSSFILNFYMKKLTARWAGPLDAKSTGGGGGDVTGEVVDDRWWSGRQVQHEQQGHMAECCCWDKRSGDNGEEADDRCGLFLTLDVGDTMEPGWPPPIVVGDVDREPVDLCIDCGWPLNGFSSSMNSRSCQKSIENNQKLLPKIIEILVCYSVHFVSQTLSSHRWLNFFD